MAHSSLSTSSTQLLSQTTEKKTQQTQKRDVKQFVQLLKKIKV